MYHPVPTIGVIAQRLGEPIHRVAYVIRTRGIQPSGQAGNARVFSEAAVQLIADELRHIDHARTIRSRLSDQS